ncbi:MAG: HEAT repeat domain-containing protein [Chloroflexi bacterium]|nr:HEAT repeat domain-containing protein [Chloroflexota bacterium]
MNSLDNLLADLTSGDESLAEAASNALAQIGESALPRLKQLLESLDADHRWWAVRTLAQFDEPPVEWLVGSLNDPSPEVREAAALALSSYPNEESAPALIRALSDSDSMVGTLAANALVLIGNAAVPSLLDAYESAPLNARIHILRALAEIRDHRAIRLLMKAMDSDSAMLNYWAKEGIERLGLNMVYIKPD